MIRADSIRVLRPLFQVGDGGSIPTSALHARSLTFEQCPKPHCVALVRAWHSRLPECQDGPWTHAFRMHSNDVTFAVALWNSPSARCLPGHWRELRRMACAPDAPKNTASRFLGFMVRWFKKNEPQAERLMSYQDTAVHKGTIYKAAGWEKAWESVERVRDRSKARAGTSRAYRSNINGVDVDAVSKVRWEITVGLPPSSNEDDASAPVQTQGVLAL